MKFAACFFATLITLILSGYFTTFHLHPTPTLEVYIALSITTLCGEVRPSVGLTASLDLWFATLDICFKETEKDLFCVSEHRHKHKGMLKIHIYIYNKIYYQSVCT